ncbi:origin recognition complex subunit [Verticillium alfalfae VaMs.102]|uniref:Origin recognition complex subunit n=1 Tax=Verticillium alfalfae (strain VaMs.102 / ATCC MYA-4576 / FGSC 10136) TaxID=526221 RepID=C9SHW3_VERA1|nr:origin recognition complex subunit [Verticillium alfalfae VaMs.102]EEY18536.1 origin recognition complex subunit [Verticillium alfalfae VaMs.102]
MADTAAMPDPHFQQEDHQAAYVFRPREEGASAERAPKRRRTSKKASELRSEHADDDGSRPDSGRQAANAEDEPSWFVPLLNGAEAPACVRLRERLFRSSWQGIEGRVQTMLRDANSATLGQVAAFAWGRHAGRAAADGDRRQVPAAFIMTGANIASQDLLFRQLGARLEGGEPRSRVVRLRSAEGRKYLNYDLEGLAAFVKAHGCRHVFVAFQDSEGFDGGLLSDLIVLFSSWLTDIPFTLLFGVATSVELFQARLLKSTCQLLYGAQFDVVQTSTILEQIFKPSVAGADVSLRLGSSLLQHFIDRQHDQVTSIESFLSSLKYAYMCHFYANPLSIFAVEDNELNSELVQPEHLEAFRSLPSFRRHVEDAVETGDLQFAKSALQDDAFLYEQIFDIPSKRRAWSARLLRSLALLKSTGANQETFSQLYLKAVAEGIDLSSVDIGILTNIKRLQPADFIRMVESLLQTLGQGDQDLGLEEWKSESQEAQDLASSLEACLSESRELLSAAQRDGNTLRSSYSGSSRILRTTVVAQKVQLSRDSAALSDADKAFTKIVDNVASLLQGAAHCEPATDSFLHEAWLYESKMPYRDVFVPRPRVVFERSLMRPHDYLACDCCRGHGDGISTTLPVTSLLYHLYLEGGSLINVADLWAAFFAMVGDEADEGETVEGPGPAAAAEDAAGVRAGGGHSERVALVLFYQGLAELKALGFVKASRKKVDHIAKLKWL